MGENDSLDGSDDAQNDGIAQDLDSAEEALRKTYPQAVTIRVFDKLNPQINVHVGIEEVGESCSIASNVYAPVGWRFKEASLHNHGGDMIMVATFEKGSDR